VLADAKNKRRRAKPEFYGSESVPPVSDKSWYAVTPPVFNFILDQDRTIDEIVAWGKSQGMTGTKIRHALAWLSFENQVHYDIPNKIWRLGSEPQE
jgi:hypothetical protein